MNEQQTQQQQAPVGALGSIDTDSLPVTITMPVAGWKRVGAALVKRPYEEAADILDLMSRAVADQVQRAQEAAARTAAPASAPPAPPAPEPVTQAGPGRRPHRR